MNTLNQELKRQGHSQSIRSRIAAQANWRLLLIRGIASQINWIAADLTSDSEYQLRNILNEAEKKNREPYAK